MSGPLGSSITRPTLIAVVARRWFYTLLAAARTKNTAFCKFPRPVLDAVNLLRHSTKNAMTHCVFSVRALRTTGLSCLLVGLCLYRSPFRPSVLGLWSWPWFALMAITAAVVLFSLVFPLALVRKGFHPGRLKLRSLLLDVAVLTNGVSYLLMVIDNPGSASSILNLTMWGTVTPVTAAATWVAMTATAIATAVWVAPVLPRSLLKPATVGASLLFLVLLGEGLTRIYVQIFPTVYGAGTLATEVWMRHFVSLNSAGVPRPRTCTQTEARSAPHPDCRRLVRLRMGTAGDSGKIR